MRVLYVFPLAALASLALSGTVLAAQEAGTPTADPGRPLDTRPSIPVDPPTIQPRSAPESTPAASPQAADPDAPVSSDQGTGAAGSGAAPDDAGAAGVSGDQAAAGPGVVEPYAGGLPERAAPPRTLRAHWHVFIAFAIVWLLLFGYALSVGRRFGRLEDEVRRLGGHGA